MRLRGGAATAAVAAVAAIALAPGVGSAPARATSARAGAEWLAARQKSDGSFVQAERADLTADSLAAVVAGGVNGKVVTRALTYISRNGEDDATRAAYIGRIIAGIVAGGGDPTDHGGIDYVAMLDAEYNAVTGAYDAEQLFPNLLAANGALAARDDLPARAVDYIKANTCVGGGFSYENNCARGADIDTTSWAINVLVAAGHKKDEAVVDARAFLLSAQRGDGGFGFTQSLPTSADSTGLALSAIAALGENATRAPWRRSDGDDPVVALLKLQHGSGGFRATAGGKPNTMSTTNAVIGMAEESYPVEYRTPTEPSDEPSKDAGDDESAAEPDGDPAKGDDPETGDAGPNETADERAPVRSPEATDDAALAGRDDNDPAAPGPAGGAQSFERPRDSNQGSGGFPWYAVGGLALGGAASGAGFWLLRRQPSA